MCKIISLLNWKLRKQIENKVISCEEYRHKTDLESHDWFFKLRQNNSVKQEKLKRDREKHNENVKNLYQLKKPPRKD